MIKNLITIISFLGYFSLQMPLNASAADRSEIPPYISPTSKAQVEVRGIGMDEVRWTKGFWKDRFDLGINDVVPAEWDYFMNFTEDNFKIAAGLMKSEIGFKGTNWQDGDYYKWLEAQVAAYAINRDAKLLEDIQRRAKLIAAAQAKDGYITMHTQIGHGLMGPKSNKLREFHHPERFKTLRYHETYNMGHLMTLAVTHFRVTGDSTLLKTAMKTADFLDDYFPKADKKTSEMDFNSTQIMGLVELYRCTGNKRYLNLANRFVTAKGTGNDAMNQNARPLRKRKEAVGHAVLATVLYNGATDLAAEIHDEALISSMKNIWDDIYTRKASVTGGLGNVHNAPSPSNRSSTVQEAFSTPYRLKNSTAYNETCATFYGAFFSWRMFLLTGDVKYVNQMETSVYNNLSSMSLVGKSYFYTNPLRWYGKEHPLRSLDHHHRWTNEETCVCCPTSLVRFLCETNDYAYAKDDNTLYAILYGGNIISTNINGKRVTFDEETNYPLDGKITLRFSGELKNYFTLKLRIPEWASQSYYLLNGERHNVEAGTFASINRYWKQSDVVELHLNMQPRLIRANPKVESLRNQAAVAYGPLIYCAEIIENKDQKANLNQYLIPFNPKWNVTYRPDFLGGVNEITIENAFMHKTLDDTSLYGNIDDNLTSCKLKLIPYYAWSNRGDSEMSVFLPIKW